MSKAEQLIESLIEGSSLMSEIRDALEYVAGHYVETRVKTPGFDRNTLSVWASDKQVLRGVYDDFLKMATRGPLSRVLKKHGVVVRTRGYEDGLHVDIKSDGKMYVHLQQSSGDASMDPEVRGMTYGR